MDVEPDPPRGLAPRAVDLPSHRVPLVGQPERKEQRVVAPGTAEIEADELGAKCVLILNTHGHVDATADDGSIRTATGAKIAIFELDGARLEKNARDTRWFLPAPPPPVKADVQLKEGSELKLGDLVI